MAIRCKTLAACGPLVRVRVCAWTPCIHRMRFTPVGSGFETRVGSESQILRETQILSNSYMAPITFKMAQILDLRCVSVPAPWVLGPKNVLHLEERSLHHTVFAGRVLHPAHEYNRSVMNYELAAHGADGEYDVKRAFGQNSPPTKHIEACTIRTKSMRQCAVYSANIVHRTAYRKHKP